jgi:hypothetical protein
MKLKFPSGRIAVERLREIMSYCPESGELRWLIRPAYCMKAGDVAGSLNKKNGYVQVKVDGRSYQAHRLIWLYAYGVWPTFHIDHINGCKSDNRLANLRDVTQSQNMLNQHGPHKDNRCGVLGVYKRSDTGLYRAGIQKDGRLINLGCFESLEEAATARSRAMAQLFGGAA